MEENGIISLETQPDTSWKTQTLLIGGVVGALVGVGAAYLLSKRAEQKGTPLSITPAPCTEGRQQRADDVC